MIPTHNHLGYLPPGIHVASWQEVRERFATNPVRLQLADGLSNALKELAKAGCVMVYIDGSFVTSKPYPGDFDIAWEQHGVDETSLGWRLITPEGFACERKAQKEHYGGEIFPADAIADHLGRTYKEFFQTDAIGERKGMIAIDPRSIP